MNTMTMEEWWMKRMGKKPRKKMNMKLLLDSSTVRVKNRAKQKADKSLLTRQLREEETKFEAKTKQNISTFPVSLTSITDHTEDKD